jgi:hypothetical protein
MPYYNGTNAPTLTVQFNLGNVGIFTLGFSTLSASTGDVLGVTTPSWQTVPIADVRAISTRVGRTRENQKFQAATLSLVVDNWSGNYDPDNTSSPYRRGGYTVLTAGLDIRVLATVSGVNYTIYWGKVEQVENDLSNDPTVTFHAADVLSWLGNQVIPAGTSLPESDSYNRVLNVLTLAGYPDFFYPSIGSYSITMAAKILTVDTTAQVLIDEVVDATGGAFYAITNQLRFLPWEQLGTGTNKFTLSDLRTAGTIEYDTLESSPGALYLINDVTIDTVDGFTAYGADTSSQSRYGRFSEALTIEAKGNLSGSLDPAVQALATELATVNSNPLPRITSAEWEVSGLTTTNWQNILQTIIAQDKATINRTTVDGRALSYTCVIQAVSHDITPNSWRVSMRFSPA